MTLSISSSKQAREVGDRMLKEEKQVQDTQDITSGINPFLFQSSKQDQEIFLNLRMRALTLSTTGGRERGGVYCNCSFLKIQIVTKTMSGLHNS